MPRGSRGEKQPADVSGARRRSAATASATDHAGERVRTGPAPCALPRLQGAPGGALGRDWTNARAGMDKKQSGRATRGRRLKWLPVNEGQRQAFLCTRRRTRRCAFPFHRGLASPS
jgi:hypothetical protein